MTVTASQVFSFLEQHITPSIERREIYSGPFSTLRKCIRSIVLKVHDQGDGDDAQEIAESLRAKLSALLTDPVPFDEIFLNSVCALGESDAVEARWGHEVRVVYDQARNAASILHTIENPLIAEVRNAVLRLRATGVTWKIYCHRRSRHYFESILEHEPTTDNVFLHSVTDYRDAEPFAVLVKVGPFRSRGWSSTPDSVLSAPRSARIIQFVWSGCGDDDDFGYDPVAAIGAHVSASGSSNRGAKSAGIQWNRILIKVGDTKSSDTITDDIDDLKLFRTLEKPTHARHATLLELDDSDGVLYPRNAQVPTFDPTPNSEAPIGHRQISEALFEGMYLIWPLLGTTDLGTLHAGEGRYSPIWKGRLREEMRRDAIDFARRLRTAGIDLRNLHSCLTQWCRPPTTVIHAPQQRLHFEILVKALGIDHDVTTSTAPRRRPWWQLAWSEIGHARGEAIQTGMQEHEIVDEQLFAILTDLLPEISRRASECSIFEVSMPTARGLQGAVRFFKIRAIEEGFFVPDTMLRTIYDLTTVEQWRV
ncbi:MAG: hypothetical protein HY749_15130 [Gammaproteobacteria bacterium]|nr:hypothetical protein [Gammaproteobacteria bacterium]